jgi:hypothetical protein
MLMLHRRVKRSVRRRARGLVGVKTVVERRRGIRRTRGDSIRSASEVVEVFADSTGVVHVQAIEPGQGLSLD